MFLTFKPLYFNPETTTSDWPNNRLAEGWAGFRLTGISKFETQAIKDLADDMQKRGTAEVENADSWWLEDTEVGHYKVKYWEFAISNRADMIAFEHLLRSIPQRKHRIRVGSSAPPTMRYALSGLNWSIVRGNLGRLITVQDAGHLDEIKILAALTKEAD